MRENKTLSGKNSTQVEDIFIASLILEKGLNEGKYPSLVNWTASTLAGYKHPNPKETGPLKETGKPKKADKKKNKASTSQKPEKSVESKQSKGGDVKKLKVLIG